MTKTLLVQKPHQDAPTRVKNEGAEAVSKKRARSTKLPLTGKVVAVSALALGDASVDSSGTIIALCQSAGAQYTAQVHKKVYCLVASSSAVKHATQRVRKAWKRRIPVVTIDWVKQCIQAGKLLEMDDFRMEDKRENKSCDTSAPVAFSSSNIVLEERTVELGCCCVCHESDAKDCEWCTDCVVNKLKDAAK